MPSRVSDEPFLSICALARMTMPGMLTQAELDAMAAARGKEFDRQFLTLMIRHHEGALQMVADLFASPRAAQDVDLSVLANDVDRLTRSLTEDIEPLLPVGVRFDETVAIDAFNDVWSTLIARLRGDAWKLTADVVAQLRTKYPRLLK